MTTTKYYSYLLLTFKYSCKHSLVHSTGMSAYNIATKPIEKISLRFRNTVIFDFLVIIHRLSGQNHSFLSKLSVLGMGISPNTKQYNSISLRYRNTNYVLLRRLWYTVRTHGIELYRTLYLWPKSGAAINLNTYQIILLYQLFYDAARFTTVIEVSTRGTHTCYPRGSWLADSCSNAWLLVATKNQDYVEVGGRQDKSRVWEGLRQDSDRLGVGWRQGGVRDRLKAGGVGWRLEAGWE